LIQKFSEVAGVVLVVDTCQIPAADRADAVTQIVHDTLVAVDIGFTEGRPVTAAGAIHELGDVKNFSVQSNALTVERTTTQARDDLSPSVFLGVQRTGTSVIVQHGREALLRPGQLVLWDTTAPYTLFDPDGIRHHFFRLPINRLALPHDLITLSCAVTLGAEHPVADLAATYFRRLAARLDVFDLPDANAIAAPSIELVRALITTHLDAAELGKDAVHATLQLRILEYLRAHLHEPDLNAAQVASEHHISVRQLYKVLAAAGVTMGDWIRAERLAGCRRDLVDPATRTTSIASIARRWGFTDASSFARMFRTAYGVSPRQWRDHRLCERD
jgi:AraC-like DNA-binding protein